MSLFFRNESRNSLKIKSLFLSKNLEIASQILLKKFRFLHPTISPYSSGVQNWNPIISRNSVDKSKHRQKSATEIFGAVISAAVESGGTAGISRPHLGAVRRCGGRVAIHTLAHTRTHTYAHRPALLAAFRRDVSARLRLLMAQRYGVTRLSLSSPRLSECQEKRRETTTAGCCCCCCCCITKSAKAPKLQEDKRMHASSFYGRPMLEATTGARERRDQGSRGEPAVSTRERKREDARII